MARSVTHMIQVPGRASFSDRELLRRYADIGDQDAFATLVQRYSRLVLGVCRHTLVSGADAEDVCQATFLVLARKAKSTRWQHSVANWLYATARNLARRARMADVRRKGRERQAAVPEAAPSIDAMIARNLLDTLGEELERLPAIYREPLVLDFLEDMSREEIATRLGVAAGTVKTRLERGKKRLGHALAKRGVVGGLALLALVAASRASASTPKLVDSILAASTGTPTAAAAALANTILGGMLMTKVKTAVVVVIALCAVGGLVAYRAWNSSTLSTPELEWAANQRADTPAEETVELSGRVLKPDGTPAVGAKVTVGSQVRTSFTDRPPQAVASDDGAFKLTVPRAELALHLSSGMGRVAVVATADGFGLASKSAVAFLPKKEWSGSEKRLAVLQLVKDDAPLFGQIKTMDDQPVAGAHVELHSLWGNDGGDLKAWREAVASGKKFEETTESLLNNLVGSDLERIGTTTDAEGRFRLHGIGQGRLVVLMVRGPTVACSGFVARTEPGGKLAVDGLSSALFGPTPDGCYGQEMVLKLPPSRPVEGVVVDAETAAPLANSLVHCQRIAGVNMVPVFGERTPLFARTDATGKFRIEGLPIGNDNLLFVRSSGTLPYLPAMVEVDTTKGAGPVKAEVKLRQGVWVEGAVTDAKTGRGLVATIDVFSPASNPNRARYASQNFILPGQIYRTDWSGKFRVPAIPGRVVVAARLVGAGPEQGMESTLQAGRRYKPIQGPIKLDGLPEEANRGFYFDVNPSPIQLRIYHQLRSFEAPAGAKSVPFDLKVE